MLFKALQRLNPLHPGSSYIVETGTLRDDHSRGRDRNGWNTVAWGWYAAQTGSVASTVEISPVAMGMCRRQTAVNIAKLLYL